MAIEQNLMLLGRFIDTLPVICWYFLKSSLIYSLD